MVIIKLFLFHNNDELSEDIELELFTKLKMIKEVMHGAQFKALSYTSNNIWHLHD